MPRSIQVTRRRAAAGSGAAPGDDTATAIDFLIDTTRAPDPKGDRVNVVRSGRFLPYKTY